MLKVEDIFTHFEWEAESRGHLKEAGVEIIIEDRGLAGKSSQRGFDLGYGTDSGRHDDI